MCQNVGLCGFGGIMRLGINPTTPLTNSYCVVLKQQYVPPNMPQVLFCLSLMNFRFFYVATKLPQYILNNIFHNILIKSKSIIEYTHKDKKKRFPASGSVTFKYKGPRLINHWIFNRWQALRWTKYWRDQKRSRSTSMYIHCLLQQAEILLWN